MSISSESLSVYMCTKCTKHVEYNRLCFKTVSNPRFKSFVCLYVFHLFIKSIIFPFLCFIKQLSLCFLFDLFLFYYNQLEIKQHINVSYCLFIFCLFVWFFLLVWLFMHLFVCLFVCLLFLLYIVYRRHVLCCQMGDKLTALLILTTLPPLSHTKQFLCPFYCT